MNNTINIKCYSGSKNNEKPQAVEIDGTWFKIENIRRQELIEYFHSRKRYRMFIVETENGVMKLFHNIKEDSWEIEDVCEG